jgi:hypothetical protein
MFLAAEWPCEPVPADEQVTASFRVRGITRPGSSTQITVEPDGGAV